MLNVPGEFGRQTITFVTVTTSGQPGYLGLTPDSDSGVDVEGCRFRPVSAAEEQDSANSSSPIQSTAGVATGIWKATCPPVAAVLNAKPNGKLIVDDATYSIEGPVMPRTDMLGVLHHVTVMCRRQDSGG